MCTEKSIEDLTLNDFEKSHRWMFYSGKNEEFDPFTTLIPEQHEDFSSEAVCLIKTSYIATNEMLLDGFCYSSDDREDHTIFYKDSGFSTWYGIAEPSMDEIEAVYKLLNMRKGDLFPISYKSYDGKRLGTIEGFYYIDDETIKIKK
jgi:hypothetical protein